LQEGGECEVEEIERAVDARLDQHWGSQRGRASGGAVLEAGQGKGAGFLGAQGEGSREGILEGKAEVVLVEFHEAVGDWN